jgi:hydrogenase nickel incorporation protein HypB
MCVTCGCGTPNPTLAAVADEGAQRLVRLEADLLGANDRIARANREHFAAHGVTALNLVSSPGSGKTALLCATLRALRARDPGRPLAVIEGDQQTSLDADRIRATGVPAVQVNTGRGCHLDARMVTDAFGALPIHGHVQDGPHGHDGPHGRDGPHDHHAHGHPGAHGGGHGPGLLFIENVGNLVCPALWDLGEAAKVAVLSVTEGDDKPLKYPDLFAAARLVVINKVDLLPYVDFDVARCVAAARRVNPAVEVLQLSARTGDGLPAWLDWIDAMAASPIRPAAAHAQAPVPARTAA